MAGQTSEYELLPLNSIIRFSGNGGWGSTNTCIRYFTSPIEQFGTDMTILHNDSTFGLEILINTPGMYSVSTVSFQSNVQQFLFGISKNSTQLTTSIDSINPLNFLMAAKKSTSGAIQGVGPACITVPLVPGDIIRAHGDGQGVNGWEFFVISKIK